MFYLVSRSDKNGDGVVSREEMKSNMRRWGFSAGEIEDYVNARFKQLDRFF